MRRTAIVAAVATLLVGLLVIVRPFVAQPRDYPAQVVSPASLNATSSLPLAPGAPVCFRNAVIDRLSTQLRFRVVTGGPPAPPLEVRLRGEGYRYVAEVPAGLPDGGTAQVAVPSPTRAVALEVCIANRGEQPVELLASDDRTRSRSAATVGEERTRRSVWFSFYESSPRTILERLPQTAERMTVFRPGYVVAPLIWVLLVGLAVGVPVLAVWAYGRATADDEAGAPPPDVGESRSRWERLVR